MKYNIYNIYRCCFLLCVAMLLMGITAQGQLTWSKGPAMSTPRYAHTATALKDGHILIAGGCASYGACCMPDCEIYDPVSDAYQPTGSLNEPRSSHSATLLQDGRVLVVGGEGGGGSAEIYDPISGSWSVTQPLFHRGVHHTATLLKNGCVLVVGGRAYLSGRHG